MMTQTKKVLILLNLVLDIMGSFLFPDMFLSFYLGSPVSKLTQAVIENKGIALLVFHGQIGWQEQILTLLLELVALERQKDTLYPYEVLTRLNQIWLILLRNIRVQETTANHVVALRIRQCLQYIQEHYPEEVTLEKLAHSAGISKSECLRCFRETLQTTPYRYLMDYRLSIAAKKLRETDEPVSAIAESCGFNQQSHFGKCFREKMECTPSQYRMGEKGE